MVDNMIAQLAAELNGHTVTDSEGNMAESETAIQEAAPVDQTTVDESTTQAEKPAESEESAPQADDAEEEIPVEDESGKRYVPEKRFKGVYSKLKEAERELESIKKQQQLGQAILETPKGKKVPSNAIPVDKADVLELKMTHPQFDPNKSDYDPDLDEMGYMIWKANEGRISLLEAGKQAISKQNNLLKKIAGSKQEARLIKSVQSDQGITNKVISRTPTVDIKDMNDKQLEAWMKANGQW